jgi:hypothetical protein
MHYLRRKLRSERGQGLMEYTLVAILLASYKSNARASGIAQRRGGGFDRAFKF